MSVQGGIRDRIVGLRRVRAGDLIPNSKNWRKHPKEQQDAMQGILSEVGYVDALMVREIEGGALEIIDGHLRASTTPDTIVPVLVVDLDDAEAAKVLATFDPISALAETDGVKLDELLRQFETGDQAIAKMLDDLASEAGIVPAEDNPAKPAERMTTFEVIVTCENESQQKSLFERLKGEGYKCRVLTL